MDISATAVRFDDDSMWVELSDGRTLGVPYAWFPRLLNATPEQREAVEIGRFGLHWEDIDEDISIAGLLAGRRDQTAKPVTSETQALLSDVHVALERVSVGVGRISMETGKSGFLSPGTPAPRSGIYEQVGPRGGRTGEQADSTRGKPLPPTDRPGRGWRLVTPTHNRHGK
jgi:hypothetical protein